VKLKNQKKEDKYVLSLDEREKIREKKTIVAKLLIFPVVHHIIRKRTR
jgi:hypothetical protein